MGIVRFVVATMMLAGAIGTGGYAFGTPGPNPIAAFLCGILVVAHTGVVHWHEVEP